MKEITELIKSGDNDQLEQKLKDNPLLAESKTEQGISCLLFAVYCRNQTAVGIFKKYKKELDIFEAAAIGEIDIVKNFTDKNPEILESFSADGFTLLGLAAFFGHLPLVKLLLDQGANPNRASNNQFMVAPLHSACAISSFEIAELLIKKGADVNAKQLQGATPLHSAAHNGQTALVKLLIDNGADINAITDSGQTPLSMAQEKNFQETAELLKNHRGLKK